MSRFVFRQLMACLVSYAVLMVPGASLAANDRSGRDASGDRTDEQDKAARLAELQAQLFAADLVVRAKVANVVTVGGKAVVVLVVIKTFRGATPRKAIYAETAKQDAAGLDEREAVWLLNAMDDPRRFTLEGPEAILDIERADEVTKALEAVEYATLDDLTFTVSFDKKTYKLDEPIRLTWTIENPTEKPIVIAVPEGWVMMLGISLKRRSAEANKSVETVLDIKPNSTEMRLDAESSFRTLDATRPQITGTVSLLRLIASYSDQERRSLPTLEPGGHQVTLFADTSQLAKVPGIAIPKSAALGWLNTERLSFEIASDRLSTLDEAKTLVARLAGVEDLDEALKSDDSEVRSRAIGAVRDYACPALLPLLEELLRSNDPEIQAAACSAIAMWARHPAIIKARPFAGRLESAPIGEELSLIARTAADVAEAQKDATMIPLLLRFLGDEHVNRVSKQSIVLSIGAIAGLEINETDLDEAEATIMRWVKKHPEKVTPPETE